MTDDAGLTVRWQEASFDDVAAFWAKQYHAPIEHYEWFLDVAKGKMIFKLYVREQFPAPRVVP